MPLAVRGIWRTPQSRVACSDSQQPQRVHDVCIVLFSPVQLLSLLRLSNHAVLHCTPSFCSSSIHPSSLLPLEADDSLKPRLWHRRGEQENLCLPRPDQQTRKVSSSLEKLRVLVVTFRSVIHHPLHLLSDEITRLQPELFSVKYPNQTRGIRSHSKVNTV